MVIDAQNGLNKSNADPQQIISIIRLTDAYMRDTPPKEFFDQFTSAANAIEVFNIFSSQWDHMNYFLFERLIRSRSTESLFAAELRHTYHDIHRRMLRYIEEMKYFRKLTSVDVFCEIVEYPQETIPKNLKKDIKKANLKTLQDVDDFRRKYAMSYKLSHLVVFVKKIVKGSVIITLWVPECAEIPDILNVSSDSEEDTDMLGSVMECERPLLISCFLYACLHTV